MERSCKNIGDERSSVNIAEGLFVPVFGMQLCKMDFARIGAHNTHQLARYPVDALAREMKVPVVGEAPHFDHSFGGTGPVLVGARSRPTWVRRGGRRRPVDRRQHRRPEVGPHPLGQGYLEGLAQGRPATYPVVVGPADPF